MSSQARSLPPVTSIAILAVAALTSACGGGGGGGGDVDRNPPSIPPSLIATATSSTTIALSWGASTDDRGVIGYRVYRGGSPHSDTSGTTYPDSGLAPSTQYCYRVLAYDAAGNESGLSAESCATTTGGTTYTLNVTKAGTGSGTVTGTGISCGADCTETYASGTSVTLTAAAATGSTFAGWAGCDSTSGATCTVSMTAAHTVTATFNLQAATPAPPTNASATSLSVTRIQVAWTDASSNETGFKVERATSPTGTFTLLATTAAGATSYNDSTVAGNGTLYYYRVKATNGAGDSAASNVATAPEVGFFATADNTVRDGNVTAGVASTVYQYGGVEVGCLWNYSSGTGILLWECSWTALKFPVSSLAGKTIDSAAIWLAPSELPWWRDTTYELAAFAGSWSPSSLTMNNVPNQYTSYTSAVYPPSTLDMLGWDATNIVGQWTSGAWANNGVLIYSTEVLTYATTTRATIFESNDTTSLADLRPQIWIAWH